AHLPTTTTMRLPITSVTDIASFLSYQDDPCDEAASARAVRRSSSSRSAKMPEKGKWRKGPFFARHWDPSSHLTLGPARLARQPGFHPQQKFVNQYQRPLYASYSF